MTPCKVSTVEATRGKPTVRYGSESFKSSSYKRPKAIETILSMRRTTCSIGRAGKIPTHPPMSRKREMIKK